MNLQSIKLQIINHPSNNKFKKLGYEPVYTTSPTAKIMIVGQAPGRKAQESGLPWNDISGDNLRAWLGLSREEFYNERDIALVPMDFFYPGKGIHGDLPPRKNFAAMWHPKILSQMPDIKLILPVGAYAQKYYLGNKIKPTLTETVRSFMDYQPDFIPMVHPSPLNYNWRRQNPWFESQVVPFARQKVKNILNSSN